MCEELNDSIGNIGSDAGFSYTGSGGCRQERDEMLAEMIGRPSGKNGVPLVWTDVL